VVVPFFAFRIMVGCGLAMLGLAWSELFEFKHRWRTFVPALMTFLSFPLPFIAIITGWFTLKLVVSPG